MGIGNPLHLAFIAIVALLVLGPKRLPELARSLGKGYHEFRESLAAGAAGQDPGLAPGDEAFTAPPEEVMVAPTPYTGAPQDEWGALGVAAADAGVAAPASASFAPSGTPDASVQATSAMGPEAPPAS
jgi:sec-independent protein translocase protein TatA